MGRRPGAGQQTECKRYYSLAASATRMLIRVILTAPARIQTLLAASGRATYRFESGLCEGGFHGPRPVVVLGPPRGGGGGARWEPSLAG